jgi:hypothetical protein
MSKKIESFRKTIFDLCKRVKSDNNDYHINEILNMDYLNQFGKGNEENNDRFVSSLYYHLDTSLYWDRIYTSRVRLNSRNSFASTEALNEAIDNHEQYWFEQGND